MNATAIQQESWEISSIRCEAQRYCDQHDITDHNVFIDVCRMLAHRAFIRETEPLRALKVEVSGILLMPVGCRRLPDGTLEPLTQTMSAEQAKLMAELDGLIRGCAAKYGFTEPCGMRSNLLGVQRP